jgi:hypothetical protein
VTGPGTSGAARDAWEAPVTVAELVNAGPLAGARLYGSGETPVRHVRIVDELSVFGSVAPHTAVVLIGAAASGGWAVEMAMRRAWEQAAACVIAPSGGLSAGSGAVLAERLGVTLIFVDEDPLVTAVRVASVASRPEAARTQLVARCATRLAEAGASARRVLGVLNAELPGTSVAFLDRHGTHLAGRQQLAQSATTEGRLAEGRLAEVEVTDQAGGVLGLLVATGSSRSAGWPSVVRTVLGLAVAQLTAWAAVERLAASRDFTLQSALAERLLKEPEADPLSSAVALGWAVRGPLTGFHVRPSGWTPDLDDAPRAQTAITATLGEVPVIRRAEGWSGWSPLTPDDLAERLRHCVAVLPWPCAAGLGTPVDTLETLPETLLGAEAAAFVAERRAVARADHMGPAELLGALPAAVLRAPAAVILRPLLAMDKDGALLETLAAVLDEGGALKAAERLGVHRNTVTTRLDRIKTAGYDLDDAPTRLALQLACHVLIR